MLDGRMSIMSDIVIAERNKAAWKQAELVRFAAEAREISRKSSPSKLGAAAGWFGKKLVNAGKNLENYAYKNDKCPDYT